MYQSFCRYMAEEGMDAMIRRTGGVLVGFSGGADSSLLLFFLHKYCLETGVQLYAAHVHHGIRGEEADRDEAFCRRRAEEMHIPYYLHKADIPRIAAERGLGLEETARQVRYACFREITADLPNPDIPVATAHNADDNLETVLFHLCRGSGLHGLCGIPPIREERYIRPLLPFTGEEIRLFCREASIPYIEDGTNAQTEYTRNFIRHEIVPKLKQIQPNPERAVFRTAQLLREDDSYLEKRASEIINGRTKLPVSALRDQPFVIASRILRQMYHTARAPGCDGTLSRGHIDDILRGITGEGTRYTVCLPDKVYFRLENGYFRFAGEEPQTEREVGIPMEFPDGEGIFENEYYVMILSRKNHKKATSEFENIYKLSIQQPINFAKIKSVLRLRTRLPGDTIRYGGMTRKLKKLFSEAHIVPEERERLPIPTTVSYPLGRLMIKSCAFAALAAAITSSSVASGRA